MTQNMGDLKNILTLYFSCLVFIVCAYVQNLVLSEQFTRYDNIVLYKVCPLFIVNMRV